MILNKGEYFKEHGFVKDPFASTNAVHEELLEKYFITLPYYCSLIESIDNAKSSIVMSRKEIGKTAQRRMFEKLSETEEQLVTIVYDQFPIEGIKDTEDISLEVHLKRIIKYLLIAFLTKLMNIRMIYNIYWIHIQKRILRY